MGLINVMVGWVLAQPRGNEMAKSRVRTDRAAKQVARRKTRRLALANQRRLRAQVALRWNRRLKEWTTVEEWEKAGVMPVIAVPVVGEGSARGY